VPSLMGFAPSSHFYPAMLSHAASWGWSVVIPSHILRTLFFEHGDLALVVGGAASWTARGAYYR
jgi:hypothetical protein